MGFFKFFGDEDKDKYTKKKNTGIKEGMFDVLNPKKAADNYYNEPKKKKSSHHPRKKGNRKKKH
jgi:hypothetical protein|tara:strand:+ start:266 stop:457 length:192 start_codon:yes stop_codon:yes gene_type:complete